MDEQKSESLRATKALLAGVRTGTLSVSDPETGGAYGALVNVAVDGQFAPIVLVSSLSRHTQGLLKNPVASLMVHGELPKSSDPLTGLRTTVTGPFLKSKDAEIRAIFLARHPYAAMYADFGDFSFWQMQPEKIYIVAGFGRVYDFDFQALRSI
jgi:heme iron utilization protein